MSTRSLLEKRVENATKEVTELEMQVREKRAFLQGLQEALKMVPRELSDERRPDQILRPGSDMAKAREIIRAAGKPLHITDILAGLSKEVTRANRGSIGGSLGNYARKGEVFKKTAPNTFGLIEFETNEEPPQKEIKEEEEHKTGDEAVQIN